MKRKSCSFIFSLLILLISFFIYFPIEPHFRRPFVSRPVDPLGWLICISWIWNDPCHWWKNEGADWFRRPTRPLPSCTEFFLAAFLAAIPGTGSPSRSPSIFPFPAFCNEFTGFTGFYWVLLGFTLFGRAPMAAYLVLPSFFSSFTKFSLALSSLT